MPLPTTIVAPTSTRPEQVNELQVLNNVTRQLAAITSIPEAKDLRDKAEALRQYFKASRQGLKAQNQAAYVKILCERKAGELLSAVPRLAGGRDRKGKQGMVSMLDTIGIPWTTASRWQYLAQYPEADLLRLVAICNEDEDELTSVLVVEAARAYLNRTARHETSSDTDAKEQTEEPGNAETPATAETEAPTAPTTTAKTNSYLRCRKRVDRTNRWVEHVAETVLGLSEQDLQSIDGRSLDQSLLPTWIQEIRLGAKRMLQFAARLEREARR